MCVSERHSEWQANVIQKIIFFLEPGRDVSPEAKKNFMKYEFPLSSYTRVGTFTATGLAEGTVPQEIGKVVEMRIRVLGHNSESWIILSEVIITPCATNC